MTIHNEQFKSFLQDKNQKQYAEKIKDIKYYFFKIPYDEDCDFIQIMRVYTYNNPEGKPGLEDKSELGGIYIYSLGLLFNLEYDLRDFLSCRNVIEQQYYETLDMQGYYKNLCKDISAEIIRRVETGQFDRAEAEQLIAEGDRDIQYYKEYRERESVERSFLEGVLLEKPDICVSYDTPYAYEIDAVLKYLRCPADIINERAAAFMEDNKAVIYKQIIRAEIILRS